MPFPLITAALQTVDPVDVRRDATPEKIAQVVEQRIGRFTVACEKLAQAVEAGTIFNADYNDLKFILNRTFEYAWRGIGGDYPYPQLHTVRADARRNPNRLDFLTEVETLAHAMTVLKDKVVKKTEVQARVRAEKAAIAAAPTADKLAARAVFEDILADMKAGFATSRRTYWNSLLTILRNADPARFYWHALRKEVFTDRYTGSVQLDDASKLLQYPSAHMPNTPGVIPANVDAIIEREVEREVDEAFAAFIFKQSSKIDGILKGRGVASYTKHINGNLEGAVDFVLGDGARFEVRFTFVHKVSNRGTPFWQFPTTFHGAVDANGKKLVGALSEAGLKEAL